MAPVYVPVLKWKSGERIAVQRLSDDVKNSILPMFQIMKNSDCEEVSDQINRAWGPGAFYLDFHQDYTENKAQFLAEFIKLASFIPVVTPDTCDIYKELFKQEKVKDQGIAIRLTSQNYDSAIEVTRDITQSLNVATNASDIIIDIGQVSLPKNVLSPFAIAIQNLIKELSALHFRRIIMIGSSFPENLSVKQNAITPLPRIEWAIWQIVQKKYPNVVFGDYGSDDPLDPEFDGGFTIVPTIRYTAKDCWYIFRGIYNRQIPYDFSQFHTLSQKLINEKEIYSGQDFSWGDKVIFDCANTECAGIGEHCNHGNLSTWVKIAVNHHITYVMHQIDASSSNA